ncbi:M4 family metallopeptidase [Longispora sp. K20-0274]|uniref:M4 family metallopeptidase n=1 Tax=Longispora sp. K20-0274 TaxID=3088255 RepID=UPI003999648F
MRTKRLLAAGVALGAAVTVATAAALTATDAPGTAGANPALAASSVSDPAAALAGADQLITAKAGALFTGADEKYAARGVTSSPQGLQYVTYDRQYKGLPVVGGDFTVVTDAQGRVRSTSVAQSAPIAVDVAPTVDAARAAAVAKGQLTEPAAVEGSRLVVLAWGAPTLTWETIVSGRDKGAESRKHVFVDARTGAVARAYDEIHAEAGEGTAKYSGPNPLTIDTTLSGSTYSLKDPKRPGLSCADYANAVILSGPDNKWGNGQGTDKETGCVDAMFAAQREWDMLKSWYGRDGIDGRGNAFQIRVGLQEENAYWTGGSAPYIKIGYNSSTDKNWLSSLDVVGHEFGHGLDQYTGGGSTADSGEAGLGESTGDIFGALTEAYANEPSQYDPPDFTVGEMVNFRGMPMLRNMYDPSKVSNNPNCYSSSIPNTEVHAAAGPMNHWFYLLAVGSNRSGYPTSPTCDNSAVAGLGDTKKAGAIFYNAMLAKTTNMTHGKYRKLTLQSAKDLDPTCAQYNAVKAAWNAVSVPAQSGEATCTGSTPTASPSASPSSSPTASPSTSPTAGPTSSPTGQPGGTVTVTNPGNQSGFVGFQSFPVQIRATSSNGGTLTYSATGLPPGLSISSTGSITGTPSAAGAYTVKVTVTSSGGATGSTTFGYQIYGF